MDSKPTAPSLTELQRWMRWVLTDPRGVTSALEGRCPHLTHYPEPLPRSWSSIAEAPPLTRAQRLDIYAEGYFIRIAECLGADFPATRRVLGDERFQGLVAQYLTRYPSTSFTTSDIGRHFPKHLAEHPLTRSMYPFLGHLVALERAVLEAFFADDREPFDSRSLASIRPEDWERLSFRLDPSVSSMWSHWAIQEVWRGETSFPYRERTHLLVHRRGGKAHVAALDSGSFALLEGMREGLSLGALGERLGDRFQEETFSARFQEWTASGVIRAVHLPAVL